MKRLTGISVLGLLASLLTIAPAAPAAAIGSFGPTQEVIRTNCSPPGLEADVVAGPDKRLHGFVSIHDFTGGCEDGIWYVERRGGTWVRQRSPYTGKVLATAVDTTGTYLLHMTPEAHLRITKRTTAGVFTGGREIDGFHPAVSWDQVVGDVVAANGEWWAVWSEPEDGDISQAKTIGTDISYSVGITAPGTTTFHTSPSMALRPGGNVSMVWQQAGASGPQGPLGVGTAGPDGRWRLRRWELTPADPNVVNSSPQMSFAGGTTHIAWMRQNAPPGGPAGAPRIVTANDRLGGWTSTHTFNTGGFGPRVTMSSGKVFEAWSTSAVPGRAFVAERPTGAGTWTGMTVSPASVNLNAVVALAGVGGKATVLIYDGTRVYSRTQL